MVRVDDDGNIRSGEGCCCDLCAACPDECCVIISGRDTCAPGTAGTASAGNTTEEWGDSLSGAYWRSIIYYAAYPSPPACGEDGGYQVTMLIGECDPATGVIPCTVSSWQYDWECFDGWLGRKYTWDGTLTLNASRCPTGFVLDESSKVTTYGGEDGASTDVANDSGKEPLVPSDVITFECNPLP